MGAEATCTAVIDGQLVRGKARLESETLFFRAGDINLSAPFREMQNVSVRGGTLTLSLPGRDVSLQLGDAAAKWMEKILHPPSRLKKLGVKSEWRVSVLGPADPDFLDELGQTSASLSTRLVKPSHAIFLFLSRNTDLGRLSSLKKSLTPDGALWLVRPKGDPRFTEAAVMAAGKAAGLVDVKVVGFSPTLTAEKFVIPVKDRLGPKS
jgi:hypothetical protein